MQKPRSGGMFIAIIRQKSLNSVRSDMFIPLLKKCPVVKKELENHPVNPENHVILSNFLLLG